MSPSSQIEIDFMSPLKVVNASSAPEGSSDESDLQAALDVEPSSGTSDLAERFGVLQWTVAKQLHQYGFIYKKLYQDPHELTEQIDGEVSKMKPM
ncbi:hypothetical protein KIN20_015068 [Parelaphostrongylus tenuis]|uniref:Uncharacterized protein n=1 Tax=Parelaphostrongylus tenuis TaxID=148309 RepID=A0AAD5MEC7_PARTN|nr:hypothetical protein KIN20_015068 [Parelaphostrongylus tenuis]